jgi:agmatinase
MDIVEVAPAYDHAEITAIAAANMAYDWLGCSGQEKGRANKASWPYLAAPHRFI